METPERIDKPFFRCTFEWDEEAGKDESNDMTFERHVCFLDMHHAGEHQSKDGHAKENVPPKKIQEKRQVA